MAVQAEPVADATTVETQAVPLNTELAVVVSDEADSKACAVDVPVEPLLEVVVAGEGGRALRKP